MDSAIPQPAGGPLRVKEIRVNYYASTPGGIKHQGLLGEKENFTPTRDDQVQVEAKLSKPAYAYLIAYRPDGVSELCFPKHDDTPPPLTDTPRYPEVGEGEKAYGFEEGTGLWVFAVVASEKPLPSYNAFVRQFVGNSVWKPEPVVPSGVVWWDDGYSTVDHITANGVVHTLRGKDVELRGPAVTIKRLTDVLRTAGKADIASAIGFSVADRK